MSAMRTAVVPRRWAQRLANVYWPMVLWSAAAGGVGGLAGWALAEPLAAANGAEPTYAVYVGVAGYFLMLSAAVGAILGGLPGVLNRSVRQAVRGAVLAGLVGGWEEPSGRCPRSTCTTPWVMASWRGPSDGRVSVWPSASAPGSPRAIAGGRCAVWWAVGPADSWEGCSLT